MKLMKKLAGISFAVAFLMAMVLFANVGRDYIGYFTAKYIFIIAGALGLIFNLFSFQQGKHSPIFSLFYWAGSLIVFAGLLLYIFHLPYAYFTLLFGAGVIGVSFVLPQTEETKRKDVLDDEF